MTVANLKIGSRKFVVLPERDFARLQRDSEQYHKGLAADHVLGCLAEKELLKFRKNGGKGTPWAQVKTELGL